MSVSAEEKSQLRAERRFTVYPSLKNARRLRKEAKRYRDLSKIVDKALAGYFEKLDEDRRSVRAVRSA